MSCFKSVEKYYIGKESLVVLLGNQLYSVSVDSEPSISIKLDNQDENDLQEISKDLFFYKLARFYAWEAHEGQVDKSGEDYYKHLHEVSRRVSGLTAKTVAFLHDIVEDTKITQSLIDYYFPEDVALAVQLLTKTKGITYKEYISKIKSNSLARSVKLADLTHNSDLTRLNNITLKDIERFKKYNEAIIELLKIEGDK